MVVLMVTSYIISLPSGGSPRRFSTKIAGAFLFSLCQTHIQPILNLLPRIQVVDGIGGPEILRTAWNTLQYTIYWVISLGQPTRGGPKLKGL
jgi:hypothetical protein